MAYSESSSVLLILSRDFVSRLNFACGHKSATNTDLLSRFHPAK